MEILAENQFTITRKLFLEGMLRISRDGYGKAAGKAMLLVLGLWGAFFLYTLAVGGDIAQALCFLILITLAGLWLCAGMPRYNARRLWKAMEERCGCDLQRTTTFYPDRLVIRGEGVEAQILYPEICRVLYTPRLIVLVSTDKTGVLLARNGFTKGTETDVNMLLSGTTYKECNDND